MTHSILLVDREVSLLWAMRELFTTRGFEVDCATELEEAQALLDCRRYSIVVSEISLHGALDAEGLEIVSHIRASAPRTKVVILTADPWRESWDRRLAESVDCFLQKPQPLHELACTLERLLLEDDAAHADAS